MTTEATTYERCLVCLTRIVPDSPIDWSEYGIWRDHHIPADWRHVVTLDDSGGYDDEHADLEMRGWSVTEGKAGRGAGYSTRKDNGRRERLWLSPACHSLAQDVLDFGEPA